MNRFVPTHGKFWAVVLATGLGATAALGQDNKPAETLTPIAISEMNRTEPVDFQREILPILKQNCLACHSSAATESELVLETPADILRGGSQGPSAAPGKGAESLLLKIASHQLAPRMPPVDNKVGAVDLTPEQLGLIKLWIDQGAQGQVVRETNAARWRPLPPGVNPIYAVVVSSDGQLAACSRANQIFVYHVPSGQFLTRLADPALARQGEALDAGVADLDGVRALAISPDGDRIASGGYRVIRLWRRPRNVQSLRIAADPAAVRAVAVSPDGQLLATGTDEHHVQLWSRKTGEKLADFPGHAGPITSLAFSPDGGKLISGSIDQSVRLWDVAARKAAGRLDTPASVSAMAIVNGGAQLATGGPDKILRLWQLPTATPRPLARFPVTAMAIRPDRKQLAAAGEDGRIHLLNLPSGAVAHTLTGHVGPVTNLSFQPDGSRLASAGEDGLLCVWDLAQATLLAQIETGTVPRHVAMHPAGGQLISGDDQGAATLWNLNAPPPMQLEGGSETLPAVAATSADGKWLATAEQVDGRPAVVLRDVASGKLIKLLLAHTDAIQALAFNADSTRLFSAGADHTVRVWNLTDGKFPELIAYRGHQSAVSAVAVSADGAQAFSGGADGSLQVWNAADGVAVRELPAAKGPIVAVSMLAGGRLLAVTGAGGIHYYSAADGSLAQTQEHGGPVVAASVSRDGKLLAIAGKDEALSLYDLAGSAAPKTLAGKMAVQSLAFSAEGLRVAATGAERVLVWDVLSGRTLQALPSPGPLGCVAFGVTPQELLFASAGKTLERRVLNFNHSLAGNTGAVSGVGFSVDGGLTYTASADGSLRGFATVNGQLQFTANHGAPIVTLAVSPDGRWLATGGENQLARLWNAGGQPGQQPPLAGFSGPVLRLSFSADNSRLIAGSAGESLVFDVATGEPEQRQAGGIRELASAGEKGELLVLATEEGLRLWPVWALRRIGGQTAAIVALASANPEGTHCLVGCEDGLLRRFNLADGQVVSQFNLGAPLSAMAVRPDGKRLAAGGAGGLLRLWNLENGAQVSEFRGDFRAQARVARLTQETGLLTNKLTAATNALAAAEKDAPVRTAEAQKAKESLTAADKVLADAKAAAQTAAATKKAADTVAFEMALLAQKAAQAKTAADKALAQAETDVKKTADKAAKAKAAAANDTTNAALAQASANAEKLAAEAVVRMQAAVTAKTTADAAAATAATAASQAADAAAATIKPATDTAKAAADAATAQQTALQALRDADQAALFASEAVTRFQAESKAGQAAVDQNKIDLEAAQKAVADSQQPIRALAFSPDNLQWASAGDAPTVLTWNAETGVPIDAYEGHTSPILSLTYASDRAVLSGSADQSAVAWDLNPGWELERTIGDIDDPSILVDRVLALDFSPDGRWLAAAGGEPSRSGELKVFNVADGTQALSLPEAHQDAIFGLEFSPDGKRLAAGGADKVVRVFDAVNGKQLFLLEGHTHHVLGVSWRSDGRALASCGADNAIKVWNTETGEQQVTIGQMDKQVTAIQFIPDTPNTVSCAGDKLVRMHQSENGQNFRNFGGATDYLYAVAISRDGQIVVAGGHDSVLRVWNGANGQELQKFEPPASPPATARR